MGARRVGEKNALWEKSLCEKYTLFEDIERETGRCVEEMLVDQKYELESLTKLVEAQPWAHPKEGYVIETLDDHDNVVESINEEDWDHIEHELDTIFSQDGEYNDPEGHDPKTKGAIDV